MKYKQKIFTKILLKISRHDSTRVITQSIMSRKTGINKKVIGMFKDEAGGKQIEEFVGLRAKLYSYRMDGEDHKMCKGVKKYVVTKGTTHDDYKDCLFTKREQLRKMNGFRSCHHDIYSMELNEIALSADDDKRVLLDDRFHTLAYGHYLLC